MCRKPSASKDQNDSSCEVVLDSPASLPQMDSINANISPTASKMDLAGISDSPRPLGRRIITNLASMSGLGVLISVWILLYTDWFPVVGGLLGLGGVFAWAAFLSGLLTDDRKRDLQEGFERAVLASRTTWKVSLLLGAAFLISSSMFGSIILDATSEENARLVSLIPSGSAKGLADDLDRLAARGAQKHLAFCGWRSRKYIVKVSGLAPVLTTITPFSRTRLHLPSDFRAHPLLLVRLSPTLGADAAQGVFNLTVKRGGAIIGVIDHRQYRGESVWIGCDIDVPIPERLVNQWRVDLARLFRSMSLPDTGRGEEILNRWLTPIAVAELQPSNPGDLIEVKLTAADGHEVATRRVKVRNPRRENEVQEIYLQY